MVKSRKCGNNSERQENSVRYFQGKNKIRYSVQWTVLNKEYLWDQHLIKAADPRSLAWDGGGEEKGPKVDTQKL